MNERDPQEPVTSLSPAGATPEPPASGAQATETAQESVADDADIVIFCHPRNVRDPAQTLAVRIQQAAGELSLIMSWSDASGGPHQVALVLERKDHEDCT